MPYVFILYTFLMLYTIFYSFYWRASQPRLAGVERHYKRSGGGRFPYQKSSPGAFVQSPQLCCGDWTKV